MTRTISILLAFGFALACPPTIVGCSDGSKESGERAIEASSSTPSAAETASKVAANGTSSFEITKENIYLHEAYWPNTVQVAPDWQPPPGTPKRPQFLQGVLVRIEQNGSVRLDLARYGRADVRIDQTDVVERANAVYRGEVFKHQGNFTLQIGNILVSSVANAPGPQPSRPIKMAPVLLCVFADPRAEEFGLLAKRLAEFGEATQIVPVFIPQNVERNDLEFVHATLREHAWKAPFVYPDRAPIRTEILLREPPEGPHLLLLTREGRILFDEAYDEGAALERLEETAAALSEDALLQRARRTGDETPVHVEG